MKNLIAFLSVFYTFTLFAQVPAASTACDQAQNICNGIPVPFPLTTGPSPNPTVPASGSFSNPSTNPAGVNSGCLFSGELNPNWFVLNVTSTGPLEFQIGAAGGSGFFDWELWPYNPTTGCNDIANNSVAPAACNWNGSSGGFTGMSNGGAPAGGQASNFQPSIPVVAGEAYILMFSNYSGVNGTVSLTFPATGATIGCSGGTPDQTICLGDVATVDLLMSPGWVNATANWLVTTNVSDPTGITGVLVNPPVTTLYQVEMWDQGLIVDTIEFTIFVVDPPVPNAGIDQTICIGDVIQLAGTADDPVNNTVIWTTDATNVSPVPSINYAPNTADLNATVTVNQLGTYLFVLNESNATCGLEVDTMEVIVSELNIVGSFVAPSCFGFNDGEIHLDSPNAVEYSFDGGNTWQVDSFAVVGGAGGYFVCGRSALGCQKCINVNIVDPPLVTISVSNDTLICENGTAYMSASANGGTSYLFHWDHTLDIQPAQQVNPAIVTTYTVFAENQNGCVSANETIDVTIRAPLSGSITPWDTICPGYPTTITATVAGGIGTPYDFIWSSGEMQNGPDNHTIPANPSVTQDYIVTITDGCESTPLVMQTNIRVAPLPVPQYQILDPLQCEPAIFHVVNTTNPTMSQYNYWLVNNNDQYLNEDTITTEEFWAGTYDIQMIITSFEGCVDSLTFDDALTVIPKPIANFQYSPNPIYMFNTDVFFVNSSFNGYTYEWIFDGAYPPNSTQESVQVEYPDGITGNYDVTLITTSELGCTDTITKEVIVLPEIVIYAPNTFTPDGDEFNQNWQVFMEGIDIYDFELQIFNRWGEMIWESHDISVAWDGTYNGKVVPQGMYNWKIRASDISHDGKYTYTGHINIIR